MGANGKMGNKVSTCLYINKKVLENAKQAGLNVSKVSENALVEAIGLLSGPKLETVLNSQAPFDLEGRGRDSNPGARLHRPVDYQATCSTHTFFCEMFLKSLSTLY